MKAKPARTDFDVLILLLPLPECGGPGGTTVYTMLGLESWALQSERARQAQPLPTPVLCFLLALCLSALLDGSVPCSGSDHQQTPRRDGYRGPVDTVERLTFGLPHHAGTRGDRLFARRVQGLSGLCLQACGTSL